MSELPISFDDVVRAHERIAGVARRTPVLTSRTADALCGAAPFFKCENFQRVGAFKFRGAYNALARSVSSCPGEMWTWPGWLNCFWNNAALDFVAA